MIIEVHVKPGAKKKEVLPLDTGHYKVSVTERAIEGRANEAVRDLLADYFDRPKSKVILVYGKKGKVKRFELA